MKNSVRSIAYNGLIAALYVTLTLITYSLSFGPIQFRVAEILVLLCFFRKDYTIGLTLGCLVANLFSSINPLDAVFGTAATFAACLCVSFSKVLLLSLFYPVLINGVVVGIELYFMVDSSTSFWFYALTVALGELAVMALAYVLVMIMRKQDKFYELIRANQNVAFKL